jgi:hypothetical protein|tara:strand:- start:74 stop:679 length:606 start_codon:yes stop_codon:yes gene_type:complete
MSKTTIPTGGLADAAVTTAKITDANITTAKIADDAVTSAKATGLGITEADFFVLNAQYNSESSGNVTFTDQFVRASGDSAGRIGTGVSLDTSNGKYTFTNTGIYLILVTVGAQVQTADNEAHFNLMVNGSDVNYIYVGSSGGSSSVNKSETAMAPFIVDIDSAGSSGDYVQLRCGGDGVLFHAGGSSYHQCSISFYRLGDT